jgi:hypothetical protein
MGKQNKHDGFTTPQGYFEEFNDHLQQRLEREGLDLPHGDGFKVPEGYFNDLNSQLLLKIKTEGPKTIPLFPYKKFLYPAVAAVAALLLILALQWSKTETYTFEGLAVTDMDRYFEVYDYGMTTYEMAEIVPVDQLEVHDIVQTPLKEENIIEYLNNNLGVFEELNLENDE